MATKTIKAWINGTIQYIEVEDIVSPEQPISVEKRVDTLEDKHEVVFTDGNLLVGNGTEELEEMTPSEVLSHINGASVMTLTTAEFEALDDASVNANTLYMLTDSDDESGGDSGDGSSGGSVDYTGLVRYDSEQDLTEEQRAQARLNIGAMEVNDVYTSGLREATYTWDGVTDGKDTFQFPYGTNSDGETSYVYFCKVSDDIPSRDLLRCFNGALLTLSDGNIVYFNQQGGNVDNILSGDTIRTLAFEEFENWYAIQGLGYLGAIFFIEEAGTYEISGNQVTAPSSGIYFPFNFGSYGTSYLANLVLSTSLKNGIYLNSVDANKRFVIEVDSDGALKTVDDTFDAGSTTVKMATEAYVNERVAAGNIETDSTLSVSGAAADAKVTGDAITNLNTLVGDTSVADQIADAIVEVYVQNEEPTDAVDGSIWVDLDADGAPTTSGKVTANVYVVDAGTTDMTTIDFSQYSIGDVIVVTVQ